MIVSVIAFYLPGNTPIYTYSLFVALGVLAGLWWISQQGTQRQAAIHINAGFWALIGATIGGRTAYVAVNWGYFQSHLLEVLQIQSGGLAWAGALAGGATAVALYARLKRQQARVIADAVNPLLGPLVISAWLGCWFDGCAYGPVTSAWWGIPSRDEWGLTSTRLPVQLLSAALAALLFWSLERYARRRKHRPGTHAGLAWLGLGMLLLTASLLRADPAPTWGGLRLETWAALLLIGLALAAVLWLNIGTIHDKLSILSARRKAPPLSARDKHSG